MNLEFSETDNVKIVPAVTASMNVDPQKGFTPLCSKELPVPDGENIVEELVGQNFICGKKLVSKDVHPKNGEWIVSKEYPQLSPVVGFPDVDIHWNRHCESGTKGMELLDGLPKMSEYDFFVGKGFEPDLHPYSACYHNLSKTISTGLIEWLNQHDISTVVVGGLALNVEDTPLCVGETVIDLCKAGFQVILDMGSVRGLGSPEGQENFLKMLSGKHGVLIVNSYKEIEVI